MTGPTGPLKGAVILLDTSVLCTVLDIPGRNQHREAVHQALRDAIIKKAILVLPLAAVFETGNHIGRVRDGNRSRDLATRFAGLVQQALNRQEPWSPGNLSEPPDVAAWAERFPGHAMQRRGGELADLTIIAEWEQACLRNPTRRVLIWSLDDDLAGYDSWPQE